MHERGVPLLLQLHGARGPHGPAAFAPVEDRHGEFHESRSVDVGRSRAVGVIGLPHAADTHAQLRIERRADGPDSRLGLLRAQPCGGIVGTPLQRLGRHDPSGHRQRVADVLRELYAERGVGSAEDVEVVERDLVTLLGAHERIFGLAQPCVDHQHVALGDIALRKAAVDDLLERTDDRDILPHRGGIEFHGREVPVGVVGGIAHVEARKLLVAQRDAVAQFGLPGRGPHRTAAVDGLHQLRQEAERPAFHAVEMAHGRRETAVHREPRQVARAGLPRRLGRRIALRGGDLQLPAVIGDGSAVVGERSLPQHRDAEPKGDYRNCYLHGLRIL